ncbi:TrkA C-terminal domain-containing protein [Rubritalea marina]|uniref:TrkA C-terminal domain-containing protein n=1 Tax=Rubritalea marina TaxID=361055 RepID=UPI00037A5AFF|nr:TrkA C-terminal domain-containing protein [Rubritalea marina]
MASLSVLLTIVLLSLLAVRIGSNALQLTGVSAQAAQFQAASAFFGVGYTTNEAELVMRHPARRRIVLHLIVAGNIGITSALATLIATLMHEDNSSINNGLQLFIIIVAVLSVAFLANLKLVKAPIDSIIVRSLKHSGVVDVQDYELLLKVQDGFSVAELTIVDGHPWASLSLRESRPSDIGVVILNISRPDGQFSGAPDKDCMIYEGDQIMIYGSEDSVQAVRMLAQSADAGPLSRA